jgi:hypothetical protein
MIHPMWAQFYAAALQGLLTAKPMLMSMDVEWVPSRAAAIADDACAEYDRRNASDSGSPYRG